MKHPQKQGVQIDIELALQGCNAMQDSGCIYVAVGSKYSSVQLKHDNYYLIARCIVQVFRLRSPSTIGTINN